MSKIIRSRLIFLTPLIALFLAFGCSPQQYTQTAFGESIGGIHFDHSLEPHEYHLLAKDLQVLNSIPFDESKSTEMKRLMKLPDVSAQSLRGWLEDRVQYVVSKDFESAAYAWEVNGSPGSSGVFDDGRVSAFVTVMSNEGGPIFSRCLRLKKSCEVYIYGHGFVPVKSPRVGLIKVGEGLFMERDEVTNQTLEDITYTAVRMGTFFHEARHSDGNRASTGIALGDPLFDQYAKENGTMLMGHVQCPAGHTFANRYACDYNKNGPYTIQAHFLQSMIDSCKLCSKKSTETMRVFVADAFSRVLSGPGVTEWDDTPEGHR